MTLSKPESINAPDLCLGIILGIEKDQHPPFLQRREGMQISIDDVNALNGKYKEKDTEIQKYKGLPLLFPILSSTKLHILQDWSLVFALCNWKRDYIISKNMKRFRFSEKHTMEYRKCIHQKKGN